METVREIAKRYGVTRAAVYYWLRDGLPHKKERIVGRKERVIIDPADVRDFLRLSKSADSK